jgi:WD repeat-containing protein 35
MSGTCVRSSPASNPRLDPIIIDTNMHGIILKWNNAGTTLAVSGVQTAKNSAGEEKLLSVVQFYTSSGHFLRFLKVPGKAISALSWEHNGLRIALAVDSFIYFANIRPDHAYTLFAGDVLVYVYNRVERVDSILVFWNSKSEEKYVKYVSGGVHSIHSFGEFCLVVTDGPDGYILTVYNAIGTCVESRSIPYEPKSVAMTRTHIILAFPDFVMSWQFRGAQSVSSKFDGIGTYTFSYTF